MHDKPEDQVVLAGVRYQLFPPSPTERRLWSQEVATLARGARTRQYLIAMAGLGLCFAQARRVREDGTLPTNGRGELAPVRPSEQYQLRSYGYDLFEFGAAFEARMIDTNGAKPEELAAATEVAHRLILGFAITTEEVEHTVGNSNATRTSEPASRSV